MQPPDSAQDEILRASGQGFFDPQCRFVGGLDVQVVVADARGHDDAEPRQRLGVGGRERHVGRRDHPDARVVGERQRAPLDPQVGQQRPEPARGEALLA